MKHSFLLCLSVLAIGGCTAQQPPASAPGTTAVAPTSYAAGSAANTTSAFDGTYIGRSITNASAGSALSNAGEGSASCPNYPIPPAVTISNGLAQIDVLNLKYQGYVTPQGSLAMRSGVGQKFEGQIDPQHVLKGRSIGSCVYDVTWQRSN